MKHSKNVTYLTELIEKSSRIITRDYSEILFLQSSMKGADRFAEKSLLRAEQVIIDAIKSDIRYKTNIYSPNSSININAKYSVIFSPISGFEYFRRGLPYFSTVISLKDEDDGETIASLIELPATKEIFMAEKGRGTLYNSYLFSSAGDYRVKIRNTETIEQAFIYTNIDLPNNNAIVIDSPSMAISHIVSGRADVGIFKNISQLETGAFSLLAKESGTIISNYSDLRIFSSQNLTSSVISLIQESYVRK